MGIPRDPMEALIVDIADRAQYRGMSGERDMLLQFYLGVLRGVCHNIRQSLVPAPGKDEYDLNEALFSVARLGYLLGSLCPDKMITEDLTKSAMAARAEGWEEPLEKAIKEIVQTDPNVAYKIIIRQVRAEMKRQRIKMRVGDEALRKRIRPHKEWAQAVAYARANPIPL
jgi:hypothetical protein